MRNLNQDELISINGGNCHPIVSNDPNVQHGYGVGYHIGRAVGNTIEMFADVVSTIGDAVSSFFN